MVRRHSYPSPHRVPRFRALVSANTPLRSLPGSPSDRRRDAELAVEPVVEVVDIWPPRSVLTRRMERWDRFKPWAAGVLAGALAGGLALAAADFVNAVTHSPFPPLARTIGQPIAVRMLPASRSIPVGYAAAVGTGALLGVLFAMTTRHVRRFFPLLVWSVVFFASVWIGLQACALRILATMLRPESTAVATVVFASVLALELPMRKRRLRLGEMSLDPE